MENQKFEIGQKVICIYSAQGQFTINKIYTVTDVYNEWNEERISIEADDKGIPNGWLSKYFEDAVRYLHNKEFKNKLEDLIE